MKNAIIVGASSGIGKELARCLAENGYGVGLAARRMNLLKELSCELSSPVWTKSVDLTDPQQAMSQLRELIAEMGDVELFVISAGTGFLNSDLNWEYERDTIAVNVSGFCAAVNVAISYLKTRKSGHLVGISSVAALRGDSVAPAYSASKAFVSNYLDGVRQMVHKRQLPIVVTDVQPGFVDTAMAKGDGQFWVAAPRKAAQQIFDAIRKRRKHVYVTKRWRIIAWFLRFAPDWLYYRL
ncbi:MAG: SDR family NAD(P)-dependent oxidoreductase [Candidatus Schekmanbacteria bacterium]|nr:SDR family NAD(P)-dependent oxidoreductase [Candidatus Schekmanbacteria bacterium]